MEHPILAAINMTGAVVALFSIYQGVKLERPGVYLAGVLLFLANLVLFMLNVAG